MIKTWYDGYLFSPDARNMVINPTLALFFLDTLEQECTYPRNMLDDNMATDRSKLEYISQIPGGGQLLLDLTTDGYVVEVDDIVSRFGMRDMLRDQSKDNSFIVSLLYYFGVLSLQGRTDLGKLILRVPNLVIRKLYVEQIAEMLLPDPTNKDDEMNTKQLIDEAVSLPVKERALVVDSLLRSLNQPESEIDKQWASEAKRRLSELRAGHVEAIPGNEVFSKVWNRFKK